MTWYKKILTKYKKEIIQSAIISIFITLAFSLWYFISGKGFEWQSISPVEEPALLPRLFYSALVYLTFGAVLYSVGFYKFLYSLYRGTRGGYKKYKDTKKFIWWVLILGMYFVIIPVVVSILNVVISFFCNLAILLLYLLPLAGVFLLVFLLSYTIYAVVKRRHHFQK